MASLKKWLIADPDDSATDLSRELHLHPAVVQVMLNRGIDSRSSQASYLLPQLSQLRDPGRLADIDRAVARLLQAIDRDETVGVFGDYDVDGVTSTALLVEFLQNLGLRVRRHVPHRMLDGYGLTDAGLLKLTAQGARLILSVDCGVTAHQPIATLQQQGVDIIVIDHHTLDDHLPPAVAVINPHRPDDGFGFADLCAVGTVFFVCAALRRALRDRGFFAHRDEPDLRRSLDLVALGTVADQVPLVGQNRVLVAAGLKVLRQGHRPGLQALCDVARVDLDEVDAGRVAFQLAPRINAAGRMGDAMAAVDLLLTDQDVEARSLARMLDTANLERRRIEAESFDQAIEQIGDLHGDVVPAALVLENPSWHPGVVGIVASRLVDRFARPALLIGRQGRGSGRSVPGLDLHRALSRVSDAMSGFGGHAQAVGIQLGEHEVEPLRRALMEEVSQDMRGDRPEPTLQVDAWLEVADLSVELAAELARLGPFGRGNPEPVFALDRVRFRSRQQVGSDHVRFVLDAAGPKVAGIAFHMRSRLEDGAFCDGARLAVVPEIDRYNGRQRLSLRTLDVIGPNESQRMASPGLSSGERA